MTMASGIETEPAKTVEMKRRTERERKKVRLVWTTVDFLQRCALIGFQRISDVIGFSLKIPTNVSNGDIYLLFCSKKSALLRKDFVSLSTLSGSSCVQWRFECIVSVKMRFVYGEATDKLKRKKPFFASILNARITIECLNLSVSMNSIIGFKCEKDIFTELEGEEKMTMICLAKSLRNDTSYKKIQWKPT